MLRKMSLVFSLAYFTSRMEGGTYNQRYLVTSIKGTSYFFAIECNHRDVMDLDAFTSLFQIRVIYKFMTIGNDLEAYLPSEFSSRSSRAFGREAEWRKLESWPGL